MLDRKDMRLRHRTTQVNCYSSDLNTNALGEIVVYYDDGGADSDYISNYDVLLKTGPRAGQWIPLTEAFKHHDVIVDNYNTRFGEPLADADRERGYSI